MWINLLNNPFGILKHNNNKKSIKKASMNNMEFSFEYENEITQV